MAFDIPLRKIVQLAAQAEEAGESYYRRIAAIVKDEKVKKVCLFFAGQETEHKSVFNKMAAEIKSETAGVFSADVISLLEQNIHKLKETGFQDPSFDYAAMDTTKCLEVALHLELATVAIYQEIRKAMDASFNVTFYKIINEENRHVAAIENVLKQADPKQKFQPAVAKIVQPDKIVIQRRRAAPVLQDYMYVAIIFLFFLGIIMAMVGPRTLSYFMNALVVK